MIIKFTQTKANYYAILLVILFCLGYTNVTHADNNGLKILTLNIHDGFDENGQSNLSRALQLFQAEKPDIISLQEVESNHLKFFQAAGYQVVSGMNHNLFSYGFGNAILTRHKIIYHRHHYLPSDLEQRGLNEVAVNVDGTTFIVLNTHLGLGKWERQQQFDEIRRIISYLHGPIIVCGDFNVQATDSLFNDFKGDFQEIGDTISLSNSFPTAHPKERIDQIWYSNDWRPITAQTISWDGSDHLPVEVELELSKPPVTSITKAKISKTAQDNNSLLPNVNQTLTKISLTLNAAANANKLGGSLNIPLMNKLSITGEYDDSCLTSALNYQLVTFDLRDYLSKWKIRGKGEWITSIAANPEDGTWLSWEQYYRWSDYDGTKIVISNRQNELNYNIEQISLFSKQIGYSIGFDTKQKLSLGIRFTPDQKNAVELRWYPDDPCQKWQIRWSYQ